MQDTAGVFVVHTHQRRAGQPALLLGLIKAVADFSVHSHGINASALHIKVCEAAHRYIPGG